MVIGVLESARFDQVEHAVEVGLQRSTRAERL
jgi:hypothetical protein